MNFVNKNTMKLLNILCLFLCLICLTASERSFTIDYENNCFLKDDEPFRYVSGSIHYFRVPPQLWKDRLMKMKMAGLNTIQTYVEWSQHEPEPGVYNFEGNFNLVDFLQIANSLDLLVILRAGPFIDAERDMGGFPYWLMRVNPKMQLRTFDASYIKYVDRWFGVLLPMMRPLLYKNGGPIIMVQVENEYGSLAACDAQYLSHLRNVFQTHLKDEVVYFTTDGSASSLLTCGRIDKVFQTMDFGTGANVTDLIDMMRWHQSSGPIVNSEFYPGWLDHWGAPHAQVSTEAVTETLNDILSANGSVNIYMFHGGTSFGFSAGSNGPDFQACPTSYDYDAPLSEAGDPTPKYYAIRETIGKFLPLPPGPVPTPSAKLNLGPIKMKPVGTLFDFVAAQQRSVIADYPLSFEDLSHPYGYVIYSTNIDHMPTDPALLNVPNLADRGYVYVDTVLEGILSREHKIFSIPIKIQKGETLQIIVENQGRICFGTGINDRKGIFNNVTLGTVVLKNWVMKPVQLNEDNIGSIENEIFLLKDKDVHVPNIFTGSFIINETLDTFLNVDGFHKGVAFINNFNLGRYWPIVGPQITLYVPGILLNKEPTVNTIVLLEMEGSPCAVESDCVVNLVDVPVVNGTTPTG